MEVFKVIEAKSEAELVARIMSGDQSAEQLLAERYRPGILIVITKATGDPDIAPDLCHETLLRALRAIRHKRLREPEKLPAFIWGIAQHIVTEYRKKSYKHPTQVIEEDQFVDPALNQFDLLLQKEKRLIIDEALKKLREEDRKLLYRNYIAEEDNERICEDMGISKSQLALKLHRARKRLLKKLKGKL